MSKIYLTSDLHFNHDREFIWKPRGFKSCEEMNEAIISKYNSVVEDNDDVYILGDMMLGGPNALQKGVEYVERLNGKLHLVRGNHDSLTRWDALRYLSNVVEMRNSIYLDYDGYHFYLSHYPSITGSLQQDSLKKMLLNLYGHTHQKSNFFEDMPFMYHVGVDSHACMPVNIDIIISEMGLKMRECKTFL